MKRHELCDPVARAGQLCEPGSRASLSCEPTLNLPGGEKLARVRVVDCALAGPATAYTANNVLYILGDHHHQATVGHVNVLYKSIPILIVCTHRTACNVLLIRTRGNSVLAQL